MQFKVKKGIVKIKGVFHPKGSFFDAEKDEVKGLIVSGVIVPVDYQDTKVQDIKQGPGVVYSDSRPKSDMTIEELKRFLEEANTEKVEALLQAELAKPEPRKTAVKLLQEWLEDTDVQPPSLNADDVIVT